jgi:hypothetical protein
MAFWKTSSRPDIGLFYFNELAILNQLWNYNLTLRAGALKVVSVQAKHVSGTESKAAQSDAVAHLPTFEQNREILQSKLTTFACTRC